jgi:hypothetical protein
MHRAVRSTLSWLLGSVVLSGLPLPGLAAPEICEAASAAVARETGVPAPVMLALTLTETGRRIGGRLRPWPWAANGGGQGHWFATPDEAARYAGAQLAQGRRSFDLGCFQINWHWHGAHFARPEDLLDPMVSGRYAARLLRDLHAELGSWTAAAGAYHSRTPALAARYRARFEQILADLPGGFAADPGTRVATGRGPVPDLRASAPPPDPPPPRENHFPLLRASAAQSPRLASLVPLDRGARPLIGERP